MITNPVIKERLAFFLPGMYDGGAERIMLNLANGMTSRGYPVDFVLARAEGPFMDEIPDSVRLIDLKASRVLSSTPALVRYLRHERPIALLSILYANIIALWARRLAGIPMRVILGEHNTLSSVVKGGDEPRLQSYPSLARWFYPWADGIVAVSRGVADDLAQVIKIPRERISVIYNPIVTPDLFEKSKALLDHPWFKIGEPPVLLAVGRLTLQKAFDVLIQAFNRVRKDHRVRLMILGEGEDRPALEALIREYDLEEDISMPGFVPNPYPYMVHAAAFVLSSRWEGLPTVLVEAMALGAPIISTDCPSGPREILLDGKYGQLVAVDDPFALATAIAKSLQTNLNRPPQESWKAFELEGVVDQYINILLGNRPCEK
jgi:glycosyltransferase involved in cell wall biosynthesis